MAIEPKEKSYASFALWVPLIWYALVASRNVSNWLHPEGFDLRDMNYLSGSPIDRAVYGALMLIAILILLVRKVNWVQLIRSNAWIFLLFLYMGVSILWSDFPLVSFKRWVRATGVFFIVLVVLTDPSHLEAISRLLRACFLIHLPLSIIFIKYFPTIGVGFDLDGNESWIGVTIGKNILGQVAMTCGIYSFWNIMRTWGYKTKLINFLLLLMALWLLKGSHDSYSASSLFLFLFGIVILLWLHFAKSNIKYVKRYIAISIFLIPIFILAFQLTILLFAEKTLLSIIVETAKRDMTFTGRIALWTDLLRIASQHPILGVGYGSFWIGDVAHNLWEKYSWLPGQGHNGYIDVYLELGLVGLFFLITAIFFTFKNIIETLKSNFEYGIFRMVFLSVILLNNIVESIFLRGTHNLWFLFLLVAVNAPINNDFDSRKSV